MNLPHELILAVGGLLSGILAGLLGAGGGVLCVPLLIALDYTPIQALGTSCLAVAIISISGSIQNSRMGYFSVQRVVLIGMPALITTQISAYAVSQVAPHVLLILFGSIMLLLTYLVKLRKQLIQRTKQYAKDSLIYAKKYAEQTVPGWVRSNVVKRIATGTVAGFFAGMVGGGSGTLLVPLQMLILEESIKLAIQTSVGVNIITSLSASASHASRGNVLLLPGLLLGIGGFLGAQMGTRFLPKLPDKTVSFAFNTLVVALSIYLFWKAWNLYYGG
ncbi:sulfite exporter TauE/SafE family protein [Thermocoleostomius sinensis]|jgi:uncharacterized membrane protein YfcA|uniref:Probable membrane transporter protein n=1 Tax=Thermocoleostomius sinensis A174 TaxID=2016057 RepID=A0A9E8ZC97_9CYAN|nr:sulfite exporter TauE/SafE family protein [Thermocoleostomius sinensis]WAL59264.1 sulfite exporter TauE/SafE family protein [Thermocoleostomius sinensis A174]